MKNLRFHIGCTGRSGSVYVHRMLTRMGIRSLHEKASERPFEGKPLAFVQRSPRMFQLYDGTIGWQWDINCQKLVNQALYKFHLVRDPVLFLRSAVTHDDSLYDMVERVIGTDRVRPSNNYHLTKISRAVNYWLGFLDTFSPGRTLLRVEEFHHGGAALDTFCRTCGFPPEVKKLAVMPAKPVNSRMKSDSYDADAAGKLQKAFPDLFDELMAARETVGYAAPAAEVEAKYA